MQLKTYFVNIPVHNEDGIEVWVAGEIRAETWEEAEAIAEANDYELLGPEVEGMHVEISDEEVEAIAESMKGKTLH